MDKKRQHMIPRGYLAAWSCPDPPPGKLGTIWVIQKADATKKELRSPKKYFREQDRYTLKENGGRNLAVEDALGIIERDFAGVAAKLEASEPLTGHDRVVLSFFAAAMLVRTGNFADLLGTMLRTIQAQAAKQAAKEKIEPSLSNAIAEALPNLVGENVRIGTIENSKMIIQMKLSVLVTDDGAGFVTEGRAMLRMRSGIPSSIPRSSGCRIYDAANPTLSRILLVENPAEDVREMGPAKGGPPERQNHRRLPKGVRLLEGYCARRVVPA
jgi:hypothetical protein